MDRSFIKKRKGRLAVDEPEITSVSVEDVKKVVKLFKDNDPYHPVYINYTHLGPVSRYGGLPGDIMSIDFYITTGGRNVKDLIRETEKMVDIADEKNMPSWIVISGNNSYNHGIEPLPSEQEAQTYGVFISGCSGIFYYAAQPFSVGNWHKMKQLREEISKFIPITYYGSPVKDIISKPRSILISAYKYESTIYLLAVNIKNEKTIGIFDFGKNLNLEEEAEVLFENRKVNISSNVLKDTFSGYQRHIYKIRLK